MLYSTKHIVDMFGISPSAVKNYSNDYREFLSPDASPEQPDNRIGKKTWKHRVFTGADLTVFSLIVAYRKQGMTHSDCYLALKNGQRGDMLATVGEYSLAIESKEQVLLLQNRVQQLEAQVEELKDERDQRLRLEAVLEDLRKRLADKENELREAYKHIGKLEG